MRRHLVSATLLAAVSLVLSVSASAQKFGDGPLAFEPNVGQADPQVQFLSHGKGYGFFLEGSSAVLRLGAGDSQIELNVADAQPVHAAGEQPLPGRVNYLRGTDRSQWLHEIPTFARVRMADVYPGVDLVYYGNHRQLEYDFVVHPGGDGSRIALHANDGTKMVLAADGALKMQSGDAQLEWHRPIAYQEISGQRRQVEARYEIAGANVRFVVGEYDHAHDLVIDPALRYSTYLGGNGGADGDVGYAIAVDAAGNAYVAGMAASTNFPTSGNAVQPAQHGNDDAFVAKLNPQGTGYLYATYLGGGGQDIAWALALDAAGEAFVAGQTGSGLYGTSAFPTTAGAYQRTHHAGTLNNSVFVAKLSADGADLLYSTLLSGANDSTASGIAVDGTGDAYVLTNTSSGFPMTSGAYQNTAGTHGCPVQQLADGQAQAVTKLSPDGSSLGYSTYVGHGCDYGAGIAVNAAGEAYITGHTQDSAYPVTTGAAQAKFGGVVDGFVTRLNASGSGLIYSTFLGGALADFSNAIALDANGYAYVAGATDGNFPTTAGAYRTSATNNGYRKGFITKLAPMGKGLVYSTYVVDAANVSFSSIAVSKSTEANVTGWSDGKQYPATSTADQSVCRPASVGCLTQAVVTRLNSAGTGLVYSSYFGASDASNNYFPGNIGNSIAVDGSGGFYITGRTSNGLKTTTGAAEPTYRSTSSSTDGFIAKFNVNGTPSSTTVVKITSPVSGLTVVDPVKVSASASGTSVSMMKLYVDGVLKTHVSGAVLNTSTVMATGKRQVTVQAVNKDGSIAKSTVYVTVK